MASPNPDKARMWFAREDAPYLSYLSSLKPDWDHSGEVYRELTRNMVRQGIHRVTAPNERVAQILDVRYDHAAGKNTIKSVKSIGGHTLHEGPTWALDREFFPSLPACDVGVHTRIVALSNDMRIHRYRQRAQARSTSLVCWSLVPRAPLGCRAGSTAGGSDPLLRLERGAALAGTERGSCVRTVLWAHCCLFRPAAIERWSFSLLRLVSRVLPMKLSCSMLTSVAVVVYPVSLNGIPCGPEPPAPSEMLMHQKVNAPLKGMGPTSFEYRMRRELEASKPLEEQTPCLQWFDAMIHLRCISFKIKIENLEERWERICTKEDNLVELTSCWHEATDLGATLQRAWSGVHYSDAETERLLRQQVEEITARLRGFMERARVVSTEAKGAIDTQIHFTNMEAAKLTIKESKSAIACESNEFAQLQLLPLQRHRR